jgi:hypothetical protein
MIFSSNRSFKRGATLGGDHVGLDEGALPRVAITMERFESDTG